MIFCIQTHSQEIKSKPPVKIAVIGLSHTHVHWILGRPDQKDIEIVAIVEPNKELAERYAKLHEFSMDLVYASSQEMLKEVQPEAVTAFGTIYDHLEVVETFAPLGIHVMVEKPLAVSLDHAIKMKKLADQYKIHLLTNYETTWYSSHQKAYRLLENDSIGELRKVVVHDGHKGPEEIGVNEEFLVWLRDPVLNGGGALTDFGCYGANLITWFNKGERPKSVTAITQTIKPNLYPNVDDEATIIVTYQKMQGVIQASWNWPIARKDIELYGVRGQIFCDNATDVRFQSSEESLQEKVKVAPRKQPFNDPFSFFAAVINDEITLEKFDLSGLDNNMMVMEILDAAKQSAETGATVLLK